MGDDDVTDDYIDELTGLTEPTSELMFASSGATLTIEVDEFNSVGKSIVVLILVTSLLGLARGAAELDALTHHPRALCMRTGHT